MDTFGPVAHILEHCEIYFSVFLFLKLLIDLIVMIIKHMEFKRMAGASLRFGGTLQSALYNNFLNPVMTSLYNPQASGLASDAPKKVDPRVDLELYEMRGDAKKKEERLYPAVNSAALGLSTFMYHLFNIPIILRIFFNQSLFSLFVFWKAVKYYLSAEIQTWNWSHSTQHAWISAQLLFFHFFPLFHHLLQPLWTLHHSTSSLTLKGDQQPIHPLLLLLLTYLSITQFLFLSYTRNLKTNHFDPLISPDRTFVHLFRAPDILTLRITLNQWPYSNNTDENTLPLGLE